VYFVTGATGFLGRHFIAALRQQQPSCLIRCLVRRPLDVVQPGIELIAGDLFDAEALQRGLAGCDAVVHFAGTTHAHDPAVYATVNVHGTAQLVRAAEQAAVRRFIFASSRAIGEPCGPYGASKRQAEEVIASSRLQSVILRFSEVYGPASPEGISALVRLVRTSPLVPVVRGAVLAPVAIEDAIQAVLASLVRETARATIYTVAGPQAYTFEQCVRTIASVLGVRRVYVPVPVSLLRSVALLCRLLGSERLVSDQVDRLLCEKHHDIGRAINDLSFTPRTFEEGLEALVRGETVT
jgi:NADH dehydrogenase